MNASHMLKLILASHKHTESCMKDTGTHGYSGDSSYQRVHEHRRYVAALLRSRVRFGERLVEAEEALDVHGKGVRVFEVVRQENGACHDHQLKIKHDPRFTTTEQDAPTQSETRARRDTESVTCCSARKAARSEREERGARRTGAGRDSVRWTQIGSAARCVSVCARETFWMCVKHNEGVNALISDFQKHLAFIQDTLCFSFKL